MAAIDITPVLKFMTEKGGSDLFFSTGAAIHMDVEGDTMPVNAQKMTPGMIKEIAYAIMSPAQIEEFESTLECNFAIGRKDIGRFRVNVFKQRGEVGMVIRYIKSDIPDFETLGLPLILRDLIMRKRGLVLVVGSTGSGKSTTLASMIDYRNINETGHIVTIEDPIEFVYQHKKSVVDQREVGIDTLSFEMALKNAMRQAPDVILIGEIRDRETMDYAIAFAETGHLCMATLHANSTNQAIDRIINFFPEERRHQLLMDLSLNVKAFVSQRLIPKQDGTGRAAAIEIMINSPLISDLIFKGDVHEIKEIIAKSRELGMQTFDQALFDLHESGAISYEDALRNADSVNDIRLKIKLEGKGAHNKDLSAGLDHLGIV